MASNNTFLVGAIDFGTTFSGWAYSFMHEYHADPTATMVKHWYSGTGSVVTEKTPTCALIRPDGKTLDAFGYEAENRYSSLVENDEHAEYYYFRRFKMALNKEKISRELMIEDEMGRSLPALTVFSQSIAFLANDMVTCAKNPVAGGITKEDVHWVLTVPAIWTDAGKQFMREAAVKAGIETEKLTIALEPEAASVFCRHLPMEKSSKECISALPPGVKYMILDAGGGTIDITVHEVTTSGGLKEVRAASGGGWGGVLVDNSFKELLLELFGEAVYKTFVETYTEDWLDLWRTFESKKKTIDPVSDAPVTMRLSVSLLKLFKKITGQKFEDMIGNSIHSSKLEFRGADKVRFDKSVMKGLFNNSISKTISHVSAVLQEKMAQDVKAILMVGGFSESKLLQEAMKREFKNVNLIIPKEASSSILRGAVIIGHNPKSISQRVLKKTYGIQTSNSFKEGLHPERLKKIRRNGQEDCTKVFSKHVEKDQCVQVGEPQAEKNYYPVNRSQQEFCFLVFASNLKDPKYTDEGCENVGKFTVNISNLAEKEIEKGGVSVSLTFSGTEITANARVKETGEKVSASFDFLQ